MLDDVVNNGEMGDDYAIEKDGYRVVIAKEKDGKRWILTAFDNNKKIKEKASITSLNTPSDVKGEGAVSPDASLSGDKDTKNINTLQENEQKNAIQGLDGYTEKDVTDLVEQHFKDLTGDDGLEIVGIRLSDLVLKARQERIVTLMFCWNSRVI